MRAAHISKALKWHADMSMLKCRHANVREKLKVEKDKKKKKAAELIQSIYQTLIVK